MLQSFADSYGISPEVFEKTGAFDPILSVDTRLFIDPRLVLKTTTPELENSSNTILEHFRKVILVVKNIKGKNDIFWKKANQMLTFPEVEGLCIGYATSGSSGRGMGKELRENLLDNVRAITAVGIENPELFEIVGIFQDKIGPDRISDMIAKIIIEDLILFTQRVCCDCGIPMQSMTYSKGIQQEDLPINRLTNKPIILVPKEILRDLPVAEDYGDVVTIMESNEHLRDEFNAIIGTSLASATLADKKRALRQTFVSHPEVLKDLLKAYINSNPKFYDFQNDPAGEVIWYRVSRDLPLNVPLALDLPSEHTIDDVEKIVLKICEHFKNLIENNQLAKLIYDEKNIPKHESASQLLFFGIADAYCTANQLDLSPECDAGRGPVDFKVSSGLKGKVLVEIKLTSNQQLQHGFEIQLPTYMKAEKSDRGVYLVIDNGGYSKARIDKFNDLVKKTLPPCPKVIRVDGSIKDSASKAKE